MVTTLGTNDAMECDYLCQRNVPTSPSSHLSVFNPAGKPLGAPSCLQCVLETCVVQPPNTVPPSTSRRLSRETIDENLTHCSTFFADSFAYRNNPHLLEQFAKLFSKLLHQQSHETPVSYEMLSRFYVCLGRMHMACSDLYPQETMQWPEDFDKSMRIINEQQSYRSRGDWTQVF
jgi:hypothetical protein